MDDEEPKDGPASINHRSFLSRSALVPLAADVFGGSAAGEDVAPVTPAGASIPMTLTVNDDIQSLCANGA